MPAPASVVEGSSSCAQSGTSGRALPATCSRSASYPTRCRGQARSGCGAALDHFMTHLSMTEVAVGDERPEADWGDHLTDDEYNNR